MNNPVEKTRSKRQKIVFLGIWSPLILSGFLFIVLVNTGLVFPLIIQLIAHIIALGYFLNINKPVFKAFLIMLIAMIICYPIVFSGLAVIIRGF